MHEYKHSYIYLVNKIYNTSYLQYSHNFITMLTAPPPWTLTGSGVILVAHFSKAFVQSNGFLAPYQQRAYRGWVGTVMAVDYTASPVGPYQELLFIPGLFRFGKTISFSISKIVVSTPESVWNGRRNWGIPKELACFSFDRQADGSQLVRVRSQDRLLLSMHIKPWSFRFPITTALVPGFRVTQQQLTDPPAPIQSVAGLLQTRPSATGSARLATLSQVSVDADRFPDLGRIKPLAVLSVENFRMTFPLPDAC